jgi:cellulose synthase (UDP-forming)
MAPKNYLQSNPDRDDFLKTQASKTLLAITLVMAVIYFAILAFWFPRGNTILFALLVAGEIFHLWMAFGYIYTVWDTEYQAPEDKNLNLAVDVFITVAGEPVEVVETTALAAKNMDYPNFQVYLLNDGKVAKKNNWKDMEKLAERLGVYCLTREISGGAKGGNINHALQHTNAPLVAILDADQVPHPDFLAKTAGYFIDPKMAFVQSPQFYQNHDLNEVTRGSWEQQELFFGAICKGKNRLNATFMCGTNMVIKREALLEAGGMSETNIAEDFVTSLFMHQKGWHSIYVPEILVEGLAPQDFLSYYNQQSRWARGSLEVIFKYNPIFKKGLSWGQKIQYLASASYYLSGFVVLMNALLPLIFFYTGLVPLNISTMSLAAIFLPYIILTVLVLRLTSNFTYTFRALAFSMSSFYIQIKAAAGALLGSKTKFAVTAKRQVRGNFLYLTIPHIAYILLLIVGVEATILREGLSAALFSNLAWAIFNASVFIPFIFAAMPQSAIFGAEQTQEINRQKTAYNAQAEHNSTPPQIPTPDFSILNNREQVDALKRRKF